MSFIRHTGIAPYLLSVMLVLTISGHAEEAAKSVGDQSIGIATPRGNGLFLLLADRPIREPAPDVKHVLITIHGALRNVKGYFKAGQSIVREAGAAAESTMVVAPNFPVQEDVEAFQLPADVLYWSERGWKEGLEAEGPVGISSYAALDVLLQHFSDRKLYPALRDIVITGHSAGGQVVQRYAATNQIEDRLQKVGISIRYVVANPSSYLYFDRTRPIFADGPDGASHLQGFGAANSSCRHVNRWHVGFDEAPPYIGNRPPAQIEQIYATRNVTYLLGLRDTDENDKQLDKSCSGNAEGPYRLARGIAYFQYMASRHQHDLKHRIVFVPDVGHNEKGMYASPCGMAALFDQPLPQTCTDTASSQHAPAPAPSPPPGDPGQQRQRDPYGRSRY